MRADVRRSFVFTLLSSAVLGASVFAGAPVVPSLSGRIFGADGSTPLAGVEVVAVNLETEQRFASALTDPEGHYAVAELPQGYYDVAVRTDEGWFVGERPVRVPTGGSAAVSMAVAPTPPTDEAKMPTPRSGKRNKLSAFWASMTDPLGGPVVGSAVVVGGLAVSGVAAASLFDDDGEPVQQAPSPFVP